jgi:hypothetical protein
MDIAHECAWLRQLLIAIVTLHNGEDPRLQRIRLDLHFLYLMGFGSVHNSFPQRRPSKVSSGDFVICCTRRVWWVKCPFMFSFMN